MNSGCLDQASSRSVSQCFRELPRVVHLSAVPAMEFRVASNLLSFSAAVCESPGCPAFSLSATPLMRPRVAPHSASSDISDGEFAGCPAHSLPRLPLADGSASFLAQRSWQRRHRCVCGLPCGLPRGVSHILQLRLGRCDSPAGFKPCIPGQAEDESLLPAGSCTFPTGSGCNLD
jgi:hypothetical protein